MLRRINVVKRFSSSSTSGAARPPYELPEEKLRALTAIYHQSATFITPENLSARIDEAFAAPDRLKIFQSNEATKTDLVRIRDAQRSRPKLTGWDTNILVSHSRINNVSKAAGVEWSSSLTIREQRVIDALYGVHGIGGNGGVAKYPGAETLAEEEKS